MSGPDPTAPTGLHGAMPDGRGSATIVPMERRGAPVAQLGSGNAVSEATPSDEALMHRWTNGDAAAFDTLHERHRSALWRYVAGRVGEEAHANELFQDIWMNVVRGRAGYSPDAPFRAWLFRIARNRVIDHYRRQPGAPHEPLDENTMSEVTEIALPLGPDEVAALVERGDALRTALERLPPAQRDAMVLQHAAGLTLAEVAEVVGENPETVKSRVRYARTRLRQLLRDLA